MLRSLWLFAIYASFLGLGTQAPFALSLGYVWVDMFSPQNVSYVILNQVPVALIMGGSAVGAYFLLDRRSPPRLNTITVCHILLAIWVTMTLLWSVTPAFAAEKWDWAFKTLVFAAFIPFVIRSRVQIDAFIQVFVLSLAANLLPYGAKIFLSGGGYGRELGLAGGNTGLGEGATLAAVAVMTIPLALFLRKHTLLMPKNHLFRLAYIGIALVSLFTTVGTFQRTGLVGLVVLGVAMIAKSKNKFLVGAVVAVAALAIGYFASAAWESRISTIGNYQQDGSAMTRILVWKWTLNYVMDHPLGGGFNMYVINHIEHGPTESNPEGSVEFARAFHSIYFEMLGEHGWIGLGLFLTMLIAGLVMLNHAAKRVRGMPEHEWCRDLAAALQVSLVVLMCCGAFIGIAFQPMIHYLLAMAVAVSSYARTVTSLDAGAGSKVPVMPWRSQASPNPAVASVMRGAAGRRDRPAA